MRVTTWDSDIKQPKDKGITLKDIIEDGIVDRDKAVCLDANYSKTSNCKTNSFYKWF